MEEGFVPECDVYIASSCTEEWSGEGAPLTVEYLKEETSYVWMKLLEKAEKCDRIEASKPYRFMKKIKNLVKKG